MKRNLWTWRIAGSISIGAILIFMLTAAISGIVGNRADTLLTWLWGGMMTANSWSWIVLFVTMIVGFSLVLVQVQRSGGALSLEVQKLNGALDRMNMLLGLDDSLLRLLATWMCAKDREAAMKLLLQELLRDATSAFAGEVHRAVIFLPDETSEHLRAWTHFQLPQESFTRTVFYIGRAEDDRRRGLAGETFLDGKLRVAHIVHEKERWRCDSDSYIDFDKRRPYPPYRSLVSVPIIGITPRSPMESATTCLGVVCFDSQHEVIFDNPGAEDLLLVFSRRIAAALLIYEQLRQTASQ